MRQFILSSLRSATSSLLRTAAPTIIAASPAACGLALVVAGAFAACVVPSSESDTADPQPAVATEDVGTTEQAISAGYCAHPQCVTGTAMNPSCDPVVGTVCSGDAYCCGAWGGHWDSICVNEFASHEPPGTCSGSSGSFLITTNIAITECLEIPGPIPAPGLPLVEGFCTGLPNQHFGLVDKTGGFYNIVNLFSNECISVSSGSLTPGAGIIQYPCKDLPEQNSCSRTWAPVTSRSRRRTAVFAWISPARPSSRERR
jgi:hypothetical protein